MKWKEFLRDYLTFTRKERIGLLVIILVIMGIWIFPKVSRPAKPKKVKADTSWITAAERLMTTDEPDTAQNVGGIDELAFDRRETQHFGEAAGELFNFDPNVLTLEGWKKLGIREKTIATIQNYLKKGGHFYRAEDLKKIFGIRPDEYTRLEPYIKIASPGVTAFPVEKNAESKNETFPTERKYSPVDINTADTSAFIALPGIGNKLATRIVNFRDRLGGFYSTDQIRETYGLADSAYEKIKPFLKLETISIKKININTATKDELKSHPYLKWNLANAIVEYRNQHGNFSSVADLRKISLVTDDVFDKIKFYLAL
jgi:competence ComEA-like helix-hairpin-helix protein